MEYVIYILVVFGIMALCLIVFRRKRDSVVIRAGRSGTANVAGFESAVVRKDIGLKSQSRSNVPTPWGWPGSDAVNAGARDRTASESLQRFVDHLIREKQTVEDRDYLLKRSKGLRILIEDRYGMPGNVGAGSDRLKKEPENTEVASIIFNRKTLQEVKTPWGW